MQPLFEDSCGIIQRVHAIRAWSLSQDNYQSICDVLRYGVVMCHVHRGTTVLNSSQTPPTQRSDGSQLLNQDKLLTFVFSLKAPAGQM